MHIGKHFCRMRGYTGEFKIGKTDANRMHPFYYSH